MYYHQLLPLISLTDAPATKIWLSVWKASKVRMQPCHVGHLLWHIQTVTALFNNTRSAGTKHAEPEVAAVEQESKEDVPEETMPEVWLFQRFSLQLIFFFFTILLEMFLTPLWDWTWLQRSNTAPHSLEKNNNRGPKEIHTELP